MLTATDVSPEDENVKPARLYIAVRSDLKPGEQLAQGVHAAFEFSVDHPSITEVWRRHSNFLVVVAVPDETTLLTLDSMAFTLGLQHTLVREPDYDNTVTAIALAPGKEARRLMAEFPLALKEKVVM